MLLRCNVALVVLAVSSLIGSPAADAPAATADGPADLAQELGLSATQAETILRSTYLLKPRMAMGLWPGCTGIAISERLLLSAGHCGTAGGVVAYQSHVSPAPEPVSLKLVKRSKDKASLKDYAVFERNSGVFRDFIPFDPTFDFRALQPGDQFGFAGFPDGGREGASRRQDVLLASSIRSFKLGGKESLFFLTSCATRYKKGVPMEFKGVPPPPDVRSEAAAAMTSEAVPRAGDPYCNVFFCGEIFKGNSGSPLLRMRRAEGEPTISVVGIVVVGATVQDAGLCKLVGAIPACVLRDAVQEARAEPAR